MFCSYTMETMIKNPAFLRSSHAGISFLLLLLLLTACGGGGSGNLDAGAENDTSVGGGGGTSTSRCSGFPWCDASLTPEQRTALMLAELTLEEKLQLMAGDDPDSANNGEPAVGVANGIERIGLNTVFYSDGPVGVREGMTTAHPAPLALASSFNRELARQTGAAIANEVKHKGNDVLHAPTVDVVRIYTSGRVFETFGEDPYLSAELGVPWVEGGESEGVIVNIKHYTVYHQEGLINPIPVPITAVIGSRFLYDAVIDERTLRELNLPAFEAAVQAGVGSVMCAYNYVNGDPACASTHLLQTILRDEWGFDGFVLTDYYFAQKDTINSANAGNDLEMPFGVHYSQTNLQNAISAGQISEATIDERVGNILRTLFRYGFMDRANYESDDDAIDQAAHAAIALQTAEQGTVLLKNDGVLPLNPAAISRIAIIGESSDRYVNGGGSSAVMPFSLITPRQAITDRAGGGIEVIYHPGDNAVSAAALAASVDIPIVFVTDGATEGQDRVCMNLTCIGDDGQNQDDLIAAVAAVNPDTIVVLQTGSAVLTPWRNDIAALLEAWYPGQNGGAAIAGILFGDINPQGKLPLTFPDSEDDTHYANNPAQYPGLAIAGPNGSTFQVQYSEGIFTGYRHFDENGIAPAYPYGFGLSYTSFGYSNLQVTGSGPDLTVSATITNTGTRAGTEIAQLYLSLPDPGPGVAQPPVQLKGFERITLNPGQSGVVTFTLNDRSFSYWDVTTDQWQIAPGCYGIRVGSHSRALPLNQNIAQNGGSCPP